MEATNVKQEARQIVESLPDDSTWDDLMHKIYVRQTIEAGMADSLAGRTTDVKDVSIRYWIPFIAPRVASDLRRVDDPLSSTLIQS